MNIIFMSMFCKDLTNCLYIPCALFYVSVRSKSCKIYFLFHFCVLLSLLCLTWNCRIGYQCIRFVLRFISFQQSIWLIRIPWKQYNYISTNTGKQLEMKRYLWSYRSEEKTRNSNRCDNIANGLGHSWMIMPPSSE